ACRQQARQPVEADLGLAARDDLLRCDARTADLEVHVEAERLVVAECLCRVVAGELRLRDPLQLEGDLVELSRLRLRARTAEADPQADRDRRQHNRDARHMLTPHPLPLSLASFMPPPSQRAAASAWRRARTAPPPGR